MQNPIKTLRPINYTDQGGAYKRLHIEVKLHSSLRLNFYFTWNSLKNIFGFLLKDKQKKAVTKVFLKLCGNPALVIFNEKKEKSTIEPEVLWVGERKCSRVGTAAGESLRNFLGNLKTHQS